MTELHVIYKRYIDNAFFPEVAHMNKRLIIVSGPSCVGKSPLIKALRRMYPKISFHMPILYTSRPARSVEIEGIDYYFRSESAIRSFPPHRFIVGRTRTVWQAIDLEEMQSIFTRHDLIIFEIYPTLGKLFQDHPLIERLSADFEVRTLFISPATEDEIISLQINMGFPTPTDAVAAIMLPKLIGRMQQQGKLLTPEVMEDLRIRAARAYEEMKMGENYTDWIINHDGEDSHNWKYTPPIGEAGLTLRRFVDILLK
jgi:guanylate kinase